MDFAFTAEQQALRATLRDLARERATSELVRRAEGFDAALWAAVGQLGLPGVAVEERFGGGGGDWIEAAVVLEEAGRFLLPVPLLGTLVSTAVLRAAADPGPAAALLPGLASGQRIGAVAVTADARGTGSGDQVALSGEVATVIDGDLADLLLISAHIDGQPVLAAVEGDAPGLERQPARTLDPTRRLTRVVLRDVPATRLGGAGAVATALDLHRVGLAIEALGGARRCLEMTVEYLRNRVQFGRPIGSFQALKHRAADLAVQIEAAASTAYYAAWVAAAEEEQLAVAAPLAKAVCCDTFFEVAAETIQLHGGIGFTWEHDAHLYFKRASTSRLLLGDSRTQRRLVAARAGIAGS